MGCRKGLLTGTISNRQRTIRSFVSPTTRPDTYSIVGRTTTVAWPWRLVVLSRLISTCQQTKNWGQANLLSSLTVFPLLRLPLRSNDYRIELISTHWKKAQERGLLAARKAARNFHFFLLQMQASSISTVVEVGRTPICWGLSIDRSDCETTFVPSSFGNGRCFACKPRLFFLAPAPRYTHVICSLPQTFLPRRPEFSEGTGKWPNRYKEELKCKS